MSFIVNCQLRCDTADPGYTGDTVLGRSAGTCPVYTYVTFVYAVMRVIYKVLISYAVLLR
jgi:hypothetical protein